MKHIGTFVSFLVLKFVQAEHSPTTTFAQDALSDFLKLLSPFHKPSQCLFIDKTLEYIAIDVDTLAETSELACLIYANVHQLATLLQKGHVVVTDATATFLMFNVVPRTMDAELRSSDILEIIVALLNEHFGVGAYVAPLYKGKVPGCIGSERRIREDASDCSRDDYKQYQMQGACLNPKKPGAGLSNRAMTRVGEPFCTLEDQSSICRLPMARSVSLTIGKIMEGPPFPEVFPIPNLLALNMGQFVTHETSQGQVQVGNARGAHAMAACATNRRQLRKVLSSVNVESIDIECDDPFYKKHEVRCLNFVRNRKLNEKCKIRTATFLNSATPVMDLNTIYESFNPDTREFSSTQGPDGKLQKDSKGNLIIPYLNNHQHTLLSVVNLLIAKMHDFIVDELLRLDPSLKPNEVFQTAKAINIALYQQVWYNDVLSTFIGVNNTVVNSFQDTFNNSIVPQIMQEYGATAGRFSHILVVDNVTRARCSDFSVIDTIPLEETFANVDLARQSFQHLICGSGRIAWRTAGVSPAMQNHLFFDQTLKYGTDMFSIDVERSRDACLEPYVNYLKRIFGLCIKSWDDLTFMPQKAVELFKKIYKRVEDLELYPAGIVETFTTSRMGPTLAYFTIKQFEIIKAGDPKFFTHSMNAKKIAQIKKINFTIYVCIAAQLKNALMDMNIRYIPGANDVVKCPCRTLKDCLDLSVFL